MKYDNHDDCNPSNDYGKEARLDLWDDIAGPGNRESFAHLGDSFGGFPDDEGTIEAGSRDRPKRESEGILDWGGSSSERRSEPETADTGYTQSSLSSPFSPKSRARRTSLEPVDFERQRPSGRMAPADVEPDESVVPDRDPDSGRFLSRDRKDANIGRNPDSGLFGGWL